MRVERRKKINKQLAKDNSCYILITCAEPTSDGNMEVEMTYEGDKVLASYLLQGAQTLIEEKAIEEQQLPFTENLRLAD